MNRLSNTVTGIINLFTLLISLPIIGIGLYISKNSTTCLSFLQTPLLTIGFIILIISLTGCVGACLSVARVLWVYLIVMLVVILALSMITVFGFMVTGQGGGVPVPGRVYKEYHLQGYSSWLRGRVEKSRNWINVKGCVYESRLCDRVASWTPVDYMKNGMTPVQSGCCKPPTACTYGQYEVPAGQDPDCYKWDNNPNTLCYDCDSCKAGVLDSIRKDWHKMSVVNVVILILLVCVYSVGCCAFQNIRRGDSGYYSHWHNRMSKVRPGLGCC